jgi:hypothetical protein
MANSRSPKKKGTGAYPARETYKGREIVIRSPKESPELAERAPEEGEVLLIEIDGRPIEVLQKGPDEFHSVYVPYKAYSSPLDLAKDIVDHVPSFKPEAGS